MIYHRTAQNAEEIATLLRSRGRIVIKAPARCGKTTELLRYAEERFPNGRFAVVCANEDAGKYIKRLHWCLYNGISHVEVCAKRLLGEELKGEDVNEPTILTPITVCYRVFNPSTPVVCDIWHELTEPQRNAIVNRRLFIAAVTCESKTDDWRVQFSGREGTAC